MNSDCLVKLKLYLYLRSSGTSTTTAASVSTAVTPPPKQHLPGAASPPSTAKIPLPPHMKRFLLQTLEKECAAFQALLLKKRQLQADKAFKAAVDVAQSHGLLSDLDFSNMHACICGTLELVGTLCLETLSSGNVDNYDTLPMDPLLAEHVLEAAKVEAERLESRQVGLCEEKAARFASMKTLKLGDEELQPATLEYPPMAEEFSEKISEEIPEEISEEIPCPCDLPVHSAQGYEAADEDEEEMPFPKEPSGCLTEPEVETEEEIPAPPILSPDLQQCRRGYGTKVEAEMQETPMPPNLCPNLPPQPMIEVEAHTQDATVHRGRGSDSGDSNACQPVPRPSTTIQVGRAEGVECAVKMPGSPIPVVAPAHPEILVQDLPLPRPVCVEDMPSVSPEQQARMVREKKGKGKGKAKGRGKGRGRGNKKRSKKEAEDEGDHDYEEPSNDGESSQQGSEDDDPEATATAKPKAKKAAAKARAKAAAKAAAKARPKAAAKATAKASGKTKAAKAKAKGSKKRTPPEDHDSAPKRGKPSKTDEEPAKTKGKRAPEADETHQAKMMKIRIAQREKASRKSSAYHTARLAARQAGMTEEEAKEKGKEAAKLNQTVTACSML